jgi:hypothetical protein
MLRIEPIKSYTLPRYPQGFYYERHGNYPWKIAGSIASTALLALLLSSCKPEPVGLAGPPPMPPDMVTEMEARTIINEVFARNGIKLEADIPFSFSLADQNPISLNLDGFNKDINVGYEYRTDEDVSSFTAEVTAELDKATESNPKGPYIKVIDEQNDYGEKAYRDIEKIIQDFIDDLRSRGVI